MKKSGAIIGLVIFCLVGLAFWFFAFSNKGNGRVLGTSINSFYAGKVLDVSSPPVKKSGATEPKINSESAILIHESTKYPLYAKKSDFQVPIASLTKVMTAIVALEIYKLDDVLEVKKESVEVTPSIMGLEVGEKITVENLLYGLLMNSGNDAALALSSGKTTKDEFISKMNKKSKELGLLNTEFKDPAGLDDQGRSTAIDVAVLFSYALKKTEFQKIIQTGETEVKSVDQKTVHPLKNSNRLTTGEIPLDGIVGGKTGYTPDAGHTLVCAATRNGHTLISVILKTYSNAPSATAEETRSLLTWGFESYDF